MDSEVENIAEAAGDLPLGLQSYLTETATNEAPFQHHNLVQADERRHSQTSQLEFRIGRLAEMRGLRIAGYNAACDEGDDQVVAARSCHDQRRADPLRGQGL